MVWKTPKPASMLWKMGESGFHAVEFLARRGTTNRGGENDDSSRVGRGEASEQVGMRAHPQEKDFGGRGLVDQNPVVGDVAVRVAGVIPGERMRLCVRRQGVTGKEQPGDHLEFLHVPAPADATVFVPLKRFREDGRLHQMSSRWKKSSASLQAVRPSPRSDSSMAARVSAFG